MSSWCCSTATTAAHSSRRDLNNLQSRLRHASIVLPNGDSFAISISGGVACYPEDGRDLVTLKKYADFAMYQVKRSHKGGMQEFDIGVYNEASYESQIAQEFEQMLAEERITYHFQPIFACNGEPGGLRGAHAPRNAQSSLARHGHEAGEGNRTVVRHREADHVPRARDFPPAAAERPAG